MKDLTQGSVTRHLVHMSAFLAMSMAVQTLYLLADLYWVGHLGKEAIAAVGVAGNITMIVLAYPNAGRGHNYIHRTGGWKKRSGARRAGFQSVFRHVDRDCVRSQDCRIPSAPGLL